MSYPLVRGLAAEGIPVRLTRGVLGHSRQAYYAWLRQPISERELGRLPDKRAGRRLWRRPGVRLPAAGRRA
jgi:hypothetical protein